MPDKFNELLLKQDIIELYNAGITPDYGYLMNGRFEKDMIKTLYPLKTLSGNPISWEASDTEYLFPVVSLAPKQAGSGDPSPENVRPISGYDSVTVTQSKDEAQVKQITLTLPETIYGGTVDAVSGAGRKTIDVVTFDGTENIKQGTDNLKTVYRYYISSFHMGQTLSAYPGLCSHFPVGSNDRDDVEQCIIGYENEFIYLFLNKAEFPDIDSVSSFLAEQYANGTPVQVSYPLITPEPFQATGNQALTIQPGNHTIYTDGNNISLSRKARRLEV